MENKQYAPVIIPTLNRYEHFKRCLESLEICIGADQTSVYVALDYPPSEKYETGWHKIDEYLKTKEKINGFKKLHIIRRNQNYGVCHVNANFEALLNELRGRIDRFIFSEDDNVFSKNFLEFINWGLNEFVDEKRIFSIGGYNEVLIPNASYNVFAYQRFNAWGFGIWLDRYDKVAKYYDREVIIEELNKTTLLDIFSRRVIHHAHLIGMLGRNQVWFDVIVGCLPVEEQNVIMPTITKVKNLGMDGSGQHGKGSKEIIAKHNKMIVDCSDTFTPRIKEPLFDFSELKEIFDKHFSTKHDIILMIKSVFVFALWKLFRINIYSFGH